MALQPRSKVSMMIMRPPQHGQGCAGVGDCIGGVGIGGLALRLRHGEQFAGARDVVGAGAAGEQAVVADAVEAVAAGRG